MTDREKLIASLGEAFNIENKKSQDRYRIETMQVDNHTVQRMLDIEDSPSFTSDNAAEQVVVTGCIRLLENERSYEVKSAARHLSELNSLACQQGDKEKQRVIYELAKEISLKLSMLDKASATRAVYLIHICNEINKLK